MSVGAPRSFSSRPSGSYSVLGTLWSRIPKGFENFFPKGSKKSDDSKANDESKESDRSETNDNEAWSELRNYFKVPGGGGGGGGGSPDDGGPGSQSPFGAGMALALLAGTMVLMSMMSDSAKDVITFQDFFTKYLASGYVQRIDVNGGEAMVIMEGRDLGAKIPTFQIGSVDAFERKMENLQREMGIPPRDFVPIRYTNTEGSWSTFFMRAALTAAIFGGMIMFAGRMMGGAGGVGGMGGGGPGGRGIFSMGKAKADAVIKPGSIKTRFKDVAGLDQAKLEIMEFVKFLKKPEQFTRLGAKIPKGALLVGPPGTGKTMLARATAGEAGVHFFTMSGSDFIEMFVGVGPSRVRDLFEQARKNSPCIVFIDEIDAVGRSRSSGGFSSGGNDERESTLNQLLVEMDGFKEDTNVVVLAGTNRSDILDKALLRPGRFDRQVLVDKPDIQGRKQIFEVHLKPLKLNRPVEDISERLAALTPGFAGADIANLCNEAAIIAARKAKEAVELVDFEAATDRVIGGMEKTGKIITAEEKALVAYHEAGHGVVGWFLEHADPLLKVTIIPRGPAALGYAQYLPKEVSLFNEEQILDRMCMALGGRAAEQVFFGKVSTGASDDLKRVTEMAYSQVGIYGFNKKIGQVSFHQDDSSNQFYKPYSEATAQSIDEEVRQMIDKAYERTVKVVEEYKDQCKSMAELLLEKETINHDDIVACLGPRPFDSDAYNEYLENARKAQKEREQELESLAKDGEEAADTKESGPSPEDLQPGMAMSSDTK